MCAARYNRRDTAPRRHFELPSTLIAGKKFGEPRRSFPAGFLRFYTLPLRHVIGVKNLGKMAPKTHRDLAKVVRTNGAERSLTGTER
jgi:hypothetical protein